MTSTPDNRLLGLRLRSAERGYSGRTATCEACGKPCRPAHRDRFGHLPPHGCSSTCVELALQRRAIAKRTA